MGSFIEWVEVKKGDKKQIFFLTQGDVKSYYDIDFIGHEAIRAFYGLGRRGIDRVQNSFWIESLVPAEITEKIKEFNQHWGMLWGSGAFENWTLCFILKYAPDKWRTKSAQRLLEQDPENHELVCLLEADVSSKLKAQAASQMMAILSNDHLIDILIHAPETNGMQAWNHFIADDPENHELLTILFSNAPEEWKANASFFLLEHDPTRDQLRAIIDFAPDAEQAQAQAQAQARNITI